MQENTNLKWWTMTNNEVITRWKQIQFKATNYHNPIVIARNLSIDTQLKLEITWGVSCSHPTARFLKVLRRNTHIGELRVTQEDPGLSYRSKSFKHSLNRTPNMLETNDRHCYIAVVLFFVSNGSIGAAAQALESAQPKLLISTRLQDSARLTWSDQLNGSAWIANGSDPHDSGSNLNPQANEFNNSPYPFALSSPCRRLGLRGLAAVVAKLRWRRPRDDEGSYDGGG